MRFLLGYLLAISFLASSGAVASDYSNKDLSKTVSILNAEYSKVDPSTEIAKQIKSYTDIGYSGINWALREGWAQRADWERKKGLPFKQVCLMDQYFDESPIQQLENLTLYRGHNYLPIGSDQVGHRFYSDAYVSTSLKKEVAWEFARGSEETSAVLDIIQLPTDVVPAIWLEPFTKMKNEYEVLIHRGVQFEVIDVVKTTAFVGGPRLMIRTLKAIGIHRDPKFEASLGCVD